MLRAQPDVATPGVVSDPGGRDLARACVAGDAAARRRLQEMVWPLIGAFLRFTHCNPMRVEPGDLMAYAVENDRLYRRLRTYEGRTSLRAYLAKYVLRHLFMHLAAERARREIKVVSLEDVVEEGDPSATAPNGETPAAREAEALRIFDRLTPQRRVLLKLLYIEDFELDEDDREVLGLWSGRPPDELDARIEQARATVRARELKQRSRSEKAQLVARSIQVLEERLAQFDAELAHLLPSSFRALQLSRERAGIEAKLAWRRKQHEALLAERHRAMVTLPYREIAALLNVPVGTVTSEVTRLRQTLRRSGGELAPEREEKP